MLLCGRASARGAMAVGSIPHDGPTCFVPTSAPRQLPWYALSCLWDDAYKRTVDTNRKESPMWRQP